MVGVRFSFEQMRPPMHEEKGGRVALYETSQLVTLPALLSRRVTLSLYLRVLGALPSAVPETALVSAAAAVLALLNSLVCSGWRSLGLSALLSKSAKTGNGGLGRDGSGRR